MGDSQDVTDEQLLDRIIRLRGESLAESATPLEGHPQDMDQRTALDDLSRANAERQRRRLPDVFDRGAVWEVKWAEPASDTSVTYYTDRFESREAAYARAKEIQDAFVEVDAPEGWP